MTNMREQTFGVEIEMTGITRSRAAKTIAAYFGTEASHYGGGYDAHHAKDSQGRIWKAMSDSSIRAQRKDGSHASDLYKTEVVTPILRYSDIEDLQEILRKLRKAGAVVNESTGIHIHIGAENFTPATLCNLLKNIRSKEDILYKALKVGDSRSRYCKKTNQKLIEMIERNRPATRQKLADLWYAEAPYGRDTHYNSSRYHGLNLHAYFTKGTVEFRLFNSTLHAGELKAYIQFCMAVTAKALNTKKASSRPSTSDNEKYTFRCWLLRLGLNGDEFKTCRLHLLKHLEGNSAWRHLS
ncbi:MAG: amidoligase family protein [Veillonellaceae bacterium]|nr:amidoligase family protein [Veillonellaceae bacterium]